MASTIETSLGKTETSLALLKVLAANSVDSILITDATASGKITGHDPSDVIGKRSKHGLLSKRKAL